MTMWLYQLTQTEWPVNRYRLDIWEGERWRWEVNRVSGTQGTPEPGDTICFYYAKSGCPAPGFYAWAVVLQCVEEGDTRRIHFRPVAPSDRGGTRRPARSRTQSEARPRGTPAGKR